VEVEMEVVGLGGGFGRGVQDFTSHYCFAA